MKKNIIISLALVSLLAACASKKPAEPLAAVPEPVPTPAPKKVEAAPTQPQTVAPAAKVAIDPLDVPGSLLSKRSVYYPFDVSAVQENDKPIVQAHAQYLAEHPARNVRLEGNCDERGSNEYNLALGQRRADGVKKMLELGGAKPSQLESVSYGEEKPRAFGHSEVSWWQNRRTDIHYMN